MAAARMTVYSTVITRRHGGSPWLLVTVDFFSDGAIWLLITGAIKKTEDPTCMVPDTQWRKPSPKWCVWQNSLNFMILTYHVEVYIGTSTFWNLQIQHLKAMDSAWCYVQVSVQGRLSAVVWPTKLWNSKWSLHAFCIVGTLAHNHNKRCCSVTLPEQLLLHKCCW
jgi:hypothetical protein